MVINYKKIIYNKRVGLTGYYVFRFSSLFTRFSLVINLILGCCVHKRYDEISFVFIIYLFYNIYFTILLFVNVNQFLHLMRTMWSLSRITVTLWCGRICRVSAPRTVVEWGYASPPLAHSALLARFVQVTSRALIEFLCRQELWVVIAWQLKGICYSCLYCSFSTTGINWDNEFTVISFPVQW